MLLTTLLFLPPQVCSGCPVSFWVLLLFRRPCPFSAPPSTPLVISPESPHNDEFTQFGARAPTRWPRGWGQRRRRRRGAPARTLQLWRRWRWYQWFWERRCRRGPHLCRRLPQHRPLSDVPPARRRVGNLQQEGYRESGQEAEGKEGRTGQPHHRYHHQWRPPDQVRHDSAHVGRASPSGRSKRLPARHLRPDLALAGSPQERAEAGEILPVRVWSEGGLGLCQSLPLRACGESWHWPVGPDPPSGCHARLPLHSPTPRKRRRPARHESRGLGNGNVALEYAPSAGGGAGATTVTSTTTTGRCPKRGSASGNSGKQQSTSTTSATTAAATTNSQQQQWPRDCTTTEQQWGSSWSSFDNNKSSTSNSEW